MAESTIHESLTRMLEFHGLAIVPKEATPEMIATAEAALDASDRDGFTPAEWYREMVRAHLALADR